MAAELSPQEEWGKQIYFEGTSPTGASIEAYIGENLTEIPGAVATCASCHGPDGRGKPEAGVIPSDITWDHLFKPYGHSHPWGRHHPAFTVETLKESIVFGRDPAGHTIEASMPIYSMTDEDLDALVAYMRRLEADYDPGLSETGLRIGTILPTQGRMAVIGQGILEVITAWFDEINAGGGIHGRRLELVELLFDNSGSPLAPTTRLIEQGDVFALLSPVVAGADAEILELAEDEKIPVIAPVSLFSPDPFVLNDYTFYLYSGLREQVRVLVDFTAGELGLAGGRLAVVGPDDDRYRDLRDAIEEQCRTQGWSAETAVDYLTGGLDPAVAVRQLAAAETKAIFVFEPRQLDELLAHADKIGWRPYVLLPGAFVREDLFELSGGARDRVYLSYPSSPSELTEAGLSELAEVLESQGFPIRHRTSQVSAFVAAKVLVEGLKRAGRELSRDKLLRALEKLYELETGLAPPITFGANRRIGALGAYVVAVDFQNRNFVPVGDWIVPR